MNQLPVLLRNEPITIQPLMWPSFIRDYGILIVSYSIVLTLTGSL
ncbi:hypothetical protein [Paenibacillus sp. OK003]|nr:hypothetical protein [Paenibacillus sp. OK003]